MIKNNKELNFIRNSLRSKPNWKKQKNSKRLKTPWVSLYYIYR